MADLRTDVAHSMLLMCSCRESYMEVYSVIFSEDEQSIDCCECCWS